MALYAVCVDMALYAVCAQGFVCCVWIGLCVLFESSALYVVCVDWSLYAVCVDRALYAV